jgi:hypothetical protein
LDATRIEVVYQQTIKMSGDFQRVIVGLAGTLFSEDAGGQVRLRLAQRFDHEILEDGQKSRRSGLPSRTPAGWPGILQG